MMTNNARKRPISVTYSSAAKGARKAAHRALSSASSRALADSVTTEEPNEDTHQAITSCSLSCPCSTWNGDRCSAGHQCSGYAMLAAYTAWRSPEITASPTGRRTESGDGVAPGNDRPNCDDDGSVEENEDDAECCGDSGGSDDDDGDVGERGDNGVATGGRRS